MYNSCYTLISSLRLFKKKHKTEINDFKRTTLFKTFFGIFQIWAGMEIWRAHVLQFVFFYILHFAVFFMFLLSYCYCYDFPKYSLPFSSWSSISGQFYIQKTLSYHCSQSPCQNHPWNRFIADKKDRRLNISLYRSVSLKVKVIKLWNIWHFFLRIGEYIDKFSNLHYLTFK